MPREEDQRLEGPPAVHEEPERAVRTEHSGDLGDRFPPGRHVMQRSDAPDAVEGSVAEGKMGCVAGGEPDVGSGVQSALGHAERTLRGVETHRLVSALGEHRKIESRATRELEHTPAGLIKAEGAGPPWEQGTSTVTRLFFAATRERLVELADRSLIRIQHRLLHPGDDAAESNDRRPVGGDARFQRMRPLRILANSVAVGSSGGITVLEGLGGALAEADGTDTRIVVPPPLRSRLEVAIPPARLMSVSFPSTPARLRWEQRGLPRMARSHRADVLLGMINTLPLAGSLGGVRGALLIQNIAPLLPEARRMYWGRGRLRLEALRMLTMRSVHRADVVFLFTEYGRDLVASLAPRARVVAIPPGGLPTSPAPEGPRTIEDHVVVLADLYRYKGVEQVIRAISDPRLADVRLIVAGAAMEPSYERSLRATAHREGVTDRVAFVGRIPRADVVRLVRSARCLVQPSRVESLALPMLEALQLGVPVVSSDIPVARELCGDAALYFAANDVGELADRLADLPSSPIGEVPAPLDWTRTAAALVAELRR